ncbi:MAG: Cytochrome c oxidase polypeptide I, partial [uncultured Nocardioidaceae bacterium]
LHDAQHRVVHRCLRARRLDAAVHLQRLGELQARREGPWRRPVGLRQLARVGDLLPAAAPQLRDDPAHPLGASRVRPALPGDRGQGRLPRLARDGGDPM